MNKDTGQGIDQLLSQVERDQDKYKNFGNLWVDEQTKQNSQMQEWLKHLNDQKQKVTTIGANDTIGYELINFRKRLDKIELTLETLLNMMKLILSTQIEKELKDRAEEKKTKNCHNTK